MKTPSLPLIVFLFTAPLIAFGQTESPLRNQHERELEAAKNTLVPVADTFGSSAENRPLAIALRNEAIALNLLGQSDAALVQMQRAASFAPTNPDITMQTAIVLDYLGRHDDAGLIYDNLFQRIQQWRGGRLRMVKGGEKAQLSAQDADILGVSLAITANAALNNIFRGKYDQALMQFTQVYESRSATVGPDAYTDYAALARVWLTAKIRAEDGMRAATAIEILADSLKVSTPYHDAMLKLWQGNGHWQKILAAIDGMKVSDADKENFRTEARFFAAGYYRYMKRDNETALELLDTENARPFNGCFERLFIRDEIAALRKTTH